MTAATVVKMSELVRPAPVEAEPHPSPAFDPRPLDIFRSPPTPVLAPTDFPPVIADFAFPLARAAGHDPAAYAMAAIGAAAGAIDDGVRLLLDPRTSWYESARLWLILLGGPGTAKTPAIRASMQAIFELHRQKRAEYARTVQANKATDDSADQVPVPAVFANDATVEKLSEILADNPRGLLCVFEELDSWLGSHDAYRGGQGSKDRGEWLRLFDGGPHQVDRIKRGSFFVPNWGVSILGATTPAGLRRNLANLPPDGLIQRFMPVIVRPMVASDDSVLSATVRAGRERFDQRLTEQFAAPPGTVRLSREAAAAFFARRDALRDEVQAFAAFSEPFAAHVAKQAGLLGRLALVMHCIEHGGDSVREELSGATMDRAERLMRKLTRHALALFELLGGESSATDLARRLALSILASDVRGSCIKHRLLQVCRPLRDAEEQRQWAALTALEDAGWLLPGDGRTYRGRPTAWIVNPQVHSLFAHQASKHRELRRRLRDRIHGSDDAQ